MKINTAEYAWREQITEYATLRADCIAKLKPRRDPLTLRAERAIKRAEKRSRKN